MDIIRISNSFSIGPQPETIDQHELLQLDGFRTLVNLSAKGELDQSVTPYDASVMAEDAGLRYIHFPVSISSMKFEHVDDFLGLVAGRRGSTYVHCRLGQRSGPFCLVAHAIANSIAPSAVMPLANELGIGWGAEMITDFVVGYLQSRQDNVTSLAA